VVHETPKLVNVPRDLVAILSACLVKDPDERPTAAQVAAVAGLMGLAGSADGAGSASSADGGDWLPEPVLADIARREAELAAWVEVAGGLDPEWEHAVAAAAVRAEADFEAVADTALELANAGIGVAVGVAAPPGDAVFEDAFPDVFEDVFEDGFADAFEDAPTIPAQGWFDPPPSARGERMAATEGPRRPDPPFEVSRPRTTHRRRAARRRRVPVYAAVGALVGAGTATVFLLLPRGGHDAPEPTHGPAATSPAAGSAGTAGTAGSAGSAGSVGTTQKTAPPAQGGRRSGPSPRSATTSASGSRP
jgi:hypothetical protein